MAVFSYVILGLAALILIPMIIGMAWALAHDLLYGPKNGDWWI